MKSSPEPKEVTPLLIVSLAVIIRVCESHLGCWPEMLL